MTPDLSGLEELAEVLVMLRDTLKTLLVLNRRPERPAETRSPRAEG
jgi:hypothetical protein